MTAQLEPVLNMYSPIRAPVGDSGDMISPRKHYSAARGLRRRLRSGRCLGGTRHQKSIDPRVSKQKSMQYRATSSNSGNTTPVSYIPSTLSNPPRCSRHTQQQSQRPFLEVPPETPAPTIKRRKSKKSTLENYSSHYSTIMLGGSQEVNVEYTPPLRGSSLNVCYETPHQSSSPLCDYQNTEVQVSTPVANSEIHMSPCDSLPMSHKVGVNEEVMYGKRSTLCTPCAPLRLRSKQYSLYYAILNRSAHQVESILHNGGDPNEKFFFPAQKNNGVQDYIPPLFIAVVLGCMDILKIFLKRGAVLNAVNAYGQNALHFLFNHPPPCSFLSSSLAQGSCVENDMYNAYYNVVHLSVSADRMITALRSFPTDAFSLPSPPETLPAPSTTRSCINPQLLSLECASFLIDQGINISAKDTKGLYPIDYALRVYGLKEDDELLKRLLKSTPLHNIH